MQLVIPCSIVIVRSALVPDDPSILTGPEDKGGLIQTVFAVQRRARVLKVLIAPTAIGHPAAVLVVEKRDGIALRRRPDRQIGQV